MAITKDMKITDILEVRPDASQILMEFGMHCIGCIASSGENLEQAASVHGIDVDKLVEALNN